MDPYDHSVLAKGSPDDWNPLRRAMGHSRRLAERIDLARMAPREDLASSKYCLANPGAEYIVYLPGGGDVEVDLSAAAGPLTVEWIHPTEGTIQRRGQTSGGSKRSFQAPFS